MERSVKESAVTPVRVVTLAGLPGAGKTTLAVALEQRLGLSRLSRDEIRCRYFPHLHDPDTAKLSAFARLLEELDRLLWAGRAVLVEGMPFSRPQEHRAIAALAHRHRVGVLSLWLDCPAALAQERVGRDLANQAHPMTDRTPALVDAVAARLQPPAPALVLDACQPRESLLDQALALLRPRLSLT